MEKAVGERPAARIVGVARDRDPQRRDVGAGKPIVLLGYVKFALGGVGEPAVKPRPGWIVGRKACLVTEQRERERVLSEHLAEIVRHHRRRVQPVEHALHAWAQVIAARVATRRGVIGETVEVVALVHVKGPFFLTQTLLPLIADGGRIVNISSALTRVSFPGSGPYASAKGAVEVLTRYQALGFGARGITANVIAAGAVPTDFGGGHLLFDSALQDAVVQSTALDRLATPKDIGEAITGLTTASGHWVTGQRIEASGGLRM